MKKYIKPEVEFVSFDSAAIMVGSIPSASISGEEFNNPGQVGVGANRGNAWSEYEQ